MNSSQKLVRLIGLLLLVAMAVIPPWQLTTKTKSGTTSQPTSTGYHPVWNPPETTTNNSPETMETQTGINLVRLGIQMALVLVGMNVAIFTLKTKE